MGNDKDHDELNQCDNNQGDSTDTNLNITYTQIASCSASGEFIEHRRQSLRAKLERESFERAKLGQNSFFNTFLNLFRLARNQR